MTQHGIERFYRAFSQLLIQGTHRCSTLCLLVNLHERIA